jgi:phenylpropionate dioxygenase-like ring-hydroxylating dioxygenase large terminal subunit
MKSSYRLFNRPDRFMAGWHWALPSRQLKTGQVKAVNLLGRELTLYRVNSQGNSAANQAVDLSANRSTNQSANQVIAVDAYCPHMGAHLGEGKVEGCAIRCLFHNWKFDSQGHCVEVPALDRPLSLQLKTWPTAERYGLIWVWTGGAPPGPLPTVPELEGLDCDSLLGQRFLHNCHPNVVLLNAIDAHHFNTVHHLPLQIQFDWQEPAPGAIQFNNLTRGGDSLLIRLIRPFYRQQITYSLCYWYGTVGTVTIGPDFLHCYILFALRLVEGGKTEGQTVLITPKRSNRLFNQGLLYLSQQVARYFAKGDRQIFRTIRFNFQTPTRADQSIIQFIHQVEKQPLQLWQSWESPEEPEQESQDERYLEPSQYCGL